VPLIAEYDALRFIFSGFTVDLVRGHTSPAWVKEHFAQLSVRLGYTIVPPEQAVNLLGNVELSRDTTKAIALLQMNADNYPKSSHAWDMLGTAWQARGDSKKSIAAYEKSLALDPKNKHATDMIAKERAKAP
jgi:predicted Zn-dependent protease